MNYENSINGLIKQLKGISNGLMEDEFPKCANVVKKAATALQYLSEGSDEVNTALREKTEENAKLRTELEQVKRERDAAIKDLNIVQDCRVCKKTSIHGVLKIQTSVRALSGVI